MRFGYLTTIVVLAAAFAACTKDNPNYCADASAHNCKLADAAAHEDRPATDGGDASEVGDAQVGDAVDTAPETRLPICVTDDNCSAADAGTPACETAGDAGARCVECTDNKHCKGDKPVCDVTADKCVACTGAAGNAALECKTGTQNVCNTTTMSCVECLSNTNCGGVKPICDGHSCRACKLDSECGDPGICLDTGACATAAQIVTTDFNASGCPNADGSSSKPFCSTAEAVAALGQNKFVLVIKGPANGQLTFATALPTPVTVVGRTNAALEPPTISLGVLTGVKVTAGMVTVRDVSISGGSSSSAKGAVVSGANAALTLRRVNIASGPGWGVQTDTAASLTMDQCVVKNNGAGGLSVDGSSYAITNSVFVSNLFGVRFINTKGTQQFVANTIANNTGNAATCVATTPQTLAASIVVGAVDSCMLDHTVTATTTFDASGYHLTSHVACPGGTPASVPPYDIDGDPRTTPPIDCGADQFK